MNKKKKNALRMAAGMMTFAAAASASASADVQNTWQEREGVQYDKIANVQGEFTFDQNVVTPADKVFNLFGTAATAMCAKPGFAFEEPDIANYYININGNLEKAATISLVALKDGDSETRTLKCSCAMGGAIANTQVVGIPLARVLEMVDMEEGVNTVTMKDADGYGLPIPLKTALENGAMLVYQIGGEEITAAQGAPLQLWMPQATARYFTRNVMEIELTKEESIPEMQAADDSQRAKVSVLNHANDEFRVGDQIIFEGYADDFDVAIASVEFSMDGGETWTACSTEGATTDRWVYWYFGYTAEAPGNYKLDVRARSAEGTVSPLAASVTFAVR